MSLVVIVVGTVELSGDGVPSGRLAGGLTLTLSAGFFSLRFELKRFLQLLFCCESPASCRGWPAVAIVSGREGDIEPVICRSILSSPGCSSSGGTVAGAGAGAYSAWMSDLPSAHGHGQHA